MGPQISTGEKQARKAAQHLLIPQLRRIYPPILCSNMDEYIKGNTSQTAQPMATENDELGSLTQDHNQGASPSVKKRRPHYIYPRRFL